MAYNPSHNRCACGRRKYRTAVKCKRCHNREIAALPQVWTAERRKRNGEVHAGARHWDWKGGARGWRGTGTERILREIRERRGDKCQRCGWSAGQIQVHHVKSRKETGGEWDNSDTNVLVLCGTCHRIWHNDARFGTHNFDQPAATDHLRLVRLRGKLTEYGKAVRRARRASYV